MQKNLPKNESKHKSLPTAALFFLKKLTEAIKKNKK